MFLKGRMRVLTVLSLGWLVAFTAQAETKSEPEWEFNSPQWLEGTCSAVTALQDSANANALDSDNESALAAGLLAQSCISFVAGVAVTVSQAPPYPFAGRNICVPTSGTVSDALAAVNVMLKRGAGKDPDFTNARDIVLLALLDKYPCK